MERLGDERPDRALPRVIRPREHPQTACADAHRRTRLMPGSRGPGDTSHSCDGPTPQAPSPSAAAPPRSSPAPPPARGTRAASATPARARRTDAGRVQLAAPRPRLRWRAVAEPEGRGARHAGMALVVRSPSRPSVGCRPSGARRRAAAVEAQTPLPALTERALRRRWHVRSRSRDCHPGRGFSANRGGSRRDHGGITAHVYSTPRKHRTSSGTPSRGASFPSRNTAFPPGVRAPWCSRSCRPSARGI